MSAPGAVAPLGAFRAASGRRGLPPVIFTVATAGVDAATTPEVLSRPTFRVAFALHPGVRAAWDAAGGTALSANSYRFDAAAVRAALDVVDARTLDVAGRPERSRAGRLAGAGLDAELLERAARARTGPTGPTVVIRPEARTTTVTVTCAAVELGGVNVGALGQCAQVDFDAALAALEGARAARWPTADAGSPANFNRVAELAATCVRAVPYPAAPGLATINVGARTLTDATDAVTVADAPPEAAAEVLDAVRGHSPARTVTCTAALEVAGTLDGWVPLHIDQDVVDAAVAADPVELDVAGLAGYQSRFVSSYVEVPHGAVCALAPGLGKTVCATASFAELARRDPSWTGIVVAPSAVLAQWEAELARWAPELTVTVADASNTATVAGTVGAPGGPSVVLVTPGYVAAFTEACTHAFHDVCIDEAAWLRNPTSGRSRAAWTQRGRARRGLALSGTPVSSGVDDLAALVAWACGDRHLFDPAPLSSWQATWDEPGVDGFTLAEVCGATVFTSSTGEPAPGVAAVPDVDVSYVEIDPAGADIEVSDALWDLLAERRDAVVAARGALGSTAPATAAARAARAELAAARTRLAATVTFSRVAHSAAAVAEASTLAGSATIAGLWDRHGGGAKLDWVSRRVADEVAAGRSVLIFTDSDAAVRATEAALAALDVAAVTLAGSSRRVARDRSVGAFLAGEVPVAIVGAAAQLGVNLACADVVVHLDCGTSGTVSRLVQRCARAARLGATGDRVTVVVPAIAGTLDAAIAEPLARRLTERLAAGGAGFGDDVAAHIDELLAARHACP